MWVLMMTTLIDVFSAEVVAVLRAHGRSSPEISENGCWVIVDLSLDDEGKRRVADAGGCEGECALDGLLNKQFGSVCILVRCNNKLLQCSCDACLCELKLFWVVVDN